ncbi:HRDC domain-containing protein [Moraxella sp. Tifton1]|uniref:ribonuclease D n=1 Tax=Moraxella oculi TaxID=2940516 RepID=UPI002011D11D|nr:HRDC domain-containing protein [Moraxella sp. Tifton1]MCL1623403.1 HRDC domain-containing protein [Moraxella sp. Tifton1]
MTDLTASNEQFGFFRAHDIDCLTLDDLPTLWVHTEDELYALIDEIDSIDIVALDTEFIRRSTYHPILALLQINTGQAIYLVDAPTLDLTDLWQALIEVPMMVWYACGEDLGIFYSLAKNTPLTNVFDVQIGVAYLTGRTQMGYSQAVSEILGVKLDKGESKSDWLNRPLSPEQEIYAANDVRYLLTLYKAVKSKLEEKNTLHHAHEDSNIYAKELHDITNISDDALYLEFYTPEYNRLQIGVLKELVMWREVLARAINEPRTFIINKQAMREIIEILPDSIKLLARTTINRGSLRKYGDEIIRIIRMVKSQPQEKLPPLPPPIYRSKEKPFKNALDQAISAYGQSTNIPENLLLKGRWINDLLIMVAQDIPDDELPFGLQGYRKAWVIDTLLPILRQYKPQILAGLNLE